MIGISLEASTAIGSFIVGVGAAIAGFFRFRAWWLDRRKQQRLESATYFKEKGQEEWEIQLGVEQLRRIHFATLTGIDRSTGHEAIRRCQVSLGGTDRAWMLLNGVGNFLVTTGHVANVRKLNKRDFVFFAVCAFVAFIALLTAFSIIAAVADWTERTPLSAVRLQHLFMIVVAVVWTSALTMFSLGAALQCLRYLNARNLYRELDKVRRSEQGMTVPTTPASHGHEHKRQPAEAPTATSLAPVRLEETEEV